jgi:pullulanase
MYRTKQHVGNSYNQPDEINAIDWVLKSKYNNLFNYCKGLIALRKAHPALCLANADLVRKHLSFIETDKGAAVGFVLDNVGEKDSASRIVVLLNGEREATSFNVPAGDYTVVANGEKVAVDGISQLNVKEGSPVEVGAIEPLILVAK